MQSSKLAPGRVRSPRLARFEFSIQNAKLEARVPTTEKPCVSVITAPINWSITAHIIRGVNPHHEGFLADSFTLETPINSPVCYWRGVRSFWVKKIEEWTFGQILLAWGILKKELNSCNNLLASSLFEISLDRSCATPSIVWREDS